MTAYSFEPNFAVIGRVKPTASIAELEAEQGVYSATTDFVRAHCGPVANGILDVVPKWYFEEAKVLELYPNIDVRIHRLYPGDFPAYPGWHCDGEYRETYFSQPDLDRIKVSRHVIATVSSHEGGVSNCAFMTEPMTVDIAHADSEHTLWGQVDALAKGKPSKATEDGALYLFDSWSLHKVMPARVRGWRLFFRLSMWHRPNLGDGGKLTKQEQVYKLAEGSGW